VWAGAQRRVGETDCASASCVVPAASNVAVRSSIGTSVGWMRFAAVELVVGVSLAPAPRSRRADCDSGLRVNRRDSSPWRLADGPKTARRKGPGELSTIGGRDEKPRAAGRTLTRRTGAAIAYPTDSGAEPVCEVALGPGAVSDRTTDRHQQCASATFGDRVRAHPLQPALQQYTAKSCCIRLYSGVTRSRAHCSAIQLCSAIQRCIPCSNTSLYSLQHSTIPLWSDLAFAQVSRNSSGNKVVSAISPFWKFPGK
jgi:hypothetical protein